MHQNVGGIKGRSLNVGPIMELLLCQKQTHQRALLRQVEQMILLPSVGL